MPKRWREAISMNKYVAMYLRGIVCVVAAVIIAAIIVGGISAVILFPKYLVPLLIIVVLPFVLGYLTEEES